MEATLSSTMKARPMVELLPELSDDILSKECLRILTSKKVPIKEKVLNGNTQSAMKPLPLSQLRAEILALQIQSPMRPAVTTSRKKAWNSSVKCDKKTVCHTENTQFKKNSVRKVLNFRPMPKINVNSRPTEVMESAKFQKPEFGARKSIHLRARQDSRISGVCKIPETPTISKQNENRRSVLNKENIARQNNIRKTLTSNPVVLKKFKPPIPDTPMSNESWKSSCDASFLQKEKEINDDEENTKVVAEEQTLEKIDEITPPASTPFLENRNIQNYFQHAFGSNHSIEYQDDTITNFENPSPVKDIKRDESVIISLCNLLNKATVTSPQSSTELEDLLHIEKQIEQHIEMIGNSIDVLNKMKHSELKTLQSIKKLIKEKRKFTETDSDKTITETKNTIDNQIKSNTLTVLPDCRSSKTTSVIVSPKSPSYKIPKRNSCLKNKVFCKSMPNIAYDVTKPVKGDMGVKALSMYMKMKQQMDFLNTPVTKRNVNVMDTPTVTSNNLQKQLDRLYDEH